MGKRLPAVQEVSWILQPTLVIPLTCGFASSIPRRVSRMSERIAQTDDLHLFEFMVLKWEWVNDRTR